jgi:hypothetical protein
MNFAQALMAVHNGKIVTCELWKSEGYHIRKDSFGRLVWFNGKAYEDVDVATLAMWVRQDYESWELAQ